MYFTLVEMDFVQLLLIFIGLLFAGALLKSHQVNTYMYAFRPLLESFKVEDYTVFGAPGADLERGSNDTYLLLRDTLQGYPGGLKAIGPTSARCYGMDWTRTQERAGSYNQQTNNYKHEYPDSCSSWNHDLVLDFYKAKGC